MSKPLLRGGMVTAVLLSASMLFVTQTSVAEPRGQSPQEAGQKEKDAAAETKAPDAETSGDASSSDEDETKAAAPKATEGAEAAVDNSKPEAGKTGDPYSGTANTGFPADSSPPRSV